MEVETGECCITALFFNKHLACFKQFFKCVPFTIKWYSKLQTGFCMIAIISCIVNDKLLIH